MRGPSEGDGIGEGWLMEIAVLRLYVRRDGLGRRISTFGSSCMALELAPAICDLGAIRLRHRAELK